MMLELRLRVVVPGMFFSMNTINISVRWLQQPQRLKSTVNLRVGLPLQPFPAHLSLSLVNSM